MFYGCKLLNNIIKLKYLDTKDINNFSYLFYKCSSLSGYRVSDIKGLENWNVANGNNLIICSIKAHHYLI